MQDVADQSAAPTTIGADLCAIFVSLELSRSPWLATLLSPGRGEKMSKHSVPAGDIAALLARFSELRRKACTRTWKILPNYRHSRSGVGRLLDSPCLAERRN
jgi:transposase